MPSLNRNEKVTCENCGVQITKLNLARFKKSCSAGTLFCTQCPNFFTKSRDDLIFHFDKQQCSRSFKNIQVYLVSRRISWLLCFTSTQKHSLWKTNWVWNEQY